MVTSKPQLISGASAEGVDGFRPRWEDAVDEVRLAVRADDERGFANHLIDTAQTVCCRNQRVAGDARIRCVDSTVCGARMPLVDRRVELQSGIRALPRR